MNITAANTQIYFPNVSGMDRNTARPESIAQEPAGS